jgi:hypothetical protein
MTILTVVSLVLVVLLASYLALLLVFGVGLLRARRLARSRAITEEAIRNVNTWLVVAVTSQDPSRRDHARLSMRDLLQGLKSQERQMVLFTLAHAVTGQEITVLRELSEELGVLDELETEATSGSWTDRLLAVRLMAALQVRSPRIRNHLADPQPAVRAQCAQWVVADPTEENLALLADMVEDPDDRCRFEAQDALARLGMTARDTVLGLLRSERPQRIDAGLRISTLTRDPAYSDTLRSLLATGAPKQQLLAAKSLSTADETALETLHRLVGHFDPVIRQNAVQILVENRDWRQATVIAPLLEDPSRTVRRVAGTALLRLGAPGLIILRHRATEVRAAPWRVTEPSGYQDDLTGSPR